jgi:hypothetical protein
MIVAGCIFCTSYLIFLIIVILVGVYSRLDPVCIGLFI